MSDTNHRGRPKIPGKYYTIRFHANLLVLVEEYRSFVYNKTGARISVPSAVKTLTEEGLKARGLEIESKSDEEDC